MNLSPFLRALLALLCILACARGQAATLFAIVTERAAPVAIEAAHRHLALHPKDRIELRTPAQWMALSDREAARLVGGADTILAVSLFGDPAHRLKTALARHAKLRTAVLAFNGEAGLSLMSRDGHGAMSDFPPDTLRDLSTENPPAAALRAAQAHPAAPHWLAARRLWQAGGVDNTAALLAHRLHPATPLAGPQPEPTLRVRAGRRELVDGAAWGNAARLGLTARPAVVVLDLSNMDAAVPAAVCARIEAGGQPCVQVLTRWGGASREALERLPELVAPARPAALVVLQDFVVGAAEGREAVAAALKRLDVPVFKAIRLSDRTALQWRLSPDGLPPDSVQYRVALPELQGIGQPIVVAALGQAQRDRATGIENRPPVVLDAEAGRLAARVTRWLALREKPNRDKRVALIYYNHPPGRQNIGADNLDVPASLFDMLHALKDAGYTVGELPASPEALLDRIMAHGVNLPEDRAALREMAAAVNTIGAADYAKWFGTLSPRVQREMASGLLGRLHADVLEAEKAGEWLLGRKQVDVIVKELQHLVEGADHPQRAAAMRGLEALGNGYRACLEVRAPHRCGTLEPLNRTVAGYGIEGLKGWGAAPGRIMVDQGRMLVPGLVFGNVFIGPQPPRGWEVDEELLHANTSITPPHQYLGFYHWVRDRFRADALVHVGRHSTYEFLPGKAVGLAGDDYPSLIAGDLPGIYPYIVDGVGEGTQAKRRGLAVIVDHLTPPLASTPLYDDLLALRQVVESYEAASSESLKTQAAALMRERVAALNLKAELEASMADVLEVRGIGYDAADDDLLAHEIGHYLTKLQEKFMPHGLHVFGRQWKQESVDLMLASMKKGGVEGPEVAAKLADSPRLEMLALLAGLDGRYIEPGKGNDPLRSPEALPTGRNFHAVDGDILPTKLGYRLGADLAGKAVARSSDATGSEGIILWASDAVRDEGVMVAFALAMMGAEPVWNARGIVTGVQLKPGAPRRDALVTTSGLFRDLYPNLIRLIDRAGRLALAASANTLAAQDPSLREALEAALAPLDGAAWGDEPVAGNRVAGEWLTRQRALVRAGQPVAEAGRGAAQRVFGDAPGAYGTGVNRLTERSGAWRERDEIGDAYRNRMGHAYGLDGSGEAQHAAFNAALDGIARTYHGRASNLYGLLDNNDAFDYLGGLSLAVEGRTGRVPEALILQHAQPGRADVEPLAAALLGELRGRFLNPAWLKPLMEHGYAGARTMGQEFVENLWGWQVTRPDLVKNWAWDEVKSVYFDDKHGLDLPRFLGQRHNAHVKAHMLAIFMVAAEKGFWKTDPATIRQMGGELARLVAANGLPGSGHAAPDHPMWNWLAPQLDSADAQALGITLAKARGDLLPAGSDASAASEANNANNANNANDVNSRARVVRAVLALPGTGTRAHQQAQAQVKPGDEIVVPDVPAPRAYELHREADVAEAPGITVVRLLAMLAAGLVLFGAGLWRGRAVPQPSGGRPVPQPSRSFT
ncbi:cobaltochelatase subunit CobN [Pseudoduganella umbonata]|uniref:Cobaltochelatase CobN n=1 Tax=Pseudoduganella umbonata TaxID=864828 RepID=A0A4P8HW49_9BURK|nr:cobaltochelatase subunit CobN [Pseudoduganella umbonata]MBB3221870.1 cobaltochelatase CobN [Pseudoduganella umbonata]QCP14327.1 cobaltochelatase subunit CobN [Pseudoduganella umbonata]